jgi:hypothetical protein
MEHLFEKEDSNSRDKKYTKHALILADKLQADIYRLKVTRINDDPLTMYLDSFITQLKKIEMTVKANPRYVWQELQDTFDYYYKENKSITGASVTFIWSDKLPSNALIYCVKL